MKIIVLLVIISLVLAISFLISFFWAINNGQFDDSFTPSMRAIEDDNIKGEKNVSRKI
jgi:cbb3-type cytochrome oxidase maturation protein